MAQFNLHSQWIEVARYIDSQPPSFAMFPEIVAADCVASSSNRVKIYVRTQGGSLNALLDLFTLGGKLDDPAVVETASTLRHLWSSLFPGIRDDDSIHSFNPDHYASGLCVYFELAHGRQHPFPKAYIPIRHYCPNDEFVGQMLARYFNADSNGDMGDRYLSDIKSIL